MDSTNVNSGNYYEDVDTEDSTPMLQPAKGHLGRNRTTSGGSSNSSSRGCFDYIQLAVQFGIFLALLYLGLILTETKNQVNSFANDQNAMSAAVASTMSNVVLDLPGVLGAMLLNNTLPSIMDDIFTADFAAVAKDIEPVFTHGLSAAETILCAVQDDGDDDAHPSGQPSDCSWREYMYDHESVAFIQAILENVREMPPPPAGTNNKPTSALVQRLVQFYTWVEHDVGSETWTKLHSKCTDTVNRFFKIKWDQSYPGVCRGTPPNGTNPNGTNGIDFGPLDGARDTGECYCAIHSGLDDDDDKYPRPSTHCRIGHNEDCTCFVHEWDSQLFTKHQRKTALSVCDTLAGLPPPPPPSSPPLSVDKPYGQSSDRYRTVKKDV